MKIQIFIFQFLFSLSVFSYNYPCVDINFTPYSGAENLLFLEKGLEKIDNMFFPANEITADDLTNPELIPNVSNKDQWLRKAKTVLFWIPVDASCVVTQHEVFGHGYRIRDLGPKYAKVTGYSMFVIGGTTSLDITSRLTTSQMIAIDVAGLEADAILANRVKLKWLNDGKIDGRQFGLYCLSSLTLTGYTFMVNKNPSSASETWNDISSFLFYLNNTYQDSYLGYTKVRNLSLINLVDPFLFYSIISSAVFTQYSTTTKIPMFTMGPVKYLPSLRLALTPFGVQGYLENFFLVNSIPIYLYLKWGKNGVNTYYGVGVENQRVFNSKSGALGFRIDLWRQPNVLFEQGALSVEEISALPKGASIPELYPTSVLTAQSLGAAFSVIGTYAWPKWPIRLFSELGYKSAGYLPGEALRSSPIARGGVSGKF